MNETLVYDAARDAAGGFTMTNIATILIIAGFALMAVPTIRMMRRRPEKRLRGGLNLAVVAAIAAAVIFGLPMLDARTASAGRAESIEGVIGSVTPKLITVGLMKVMISCADPSHCPGVAVGDRARVEYVDDSGPETDALAQRIWKRR